MAGRMPGDFPAWQTVYGSERAWRLDGTWLKVHFGTLPVGKGCCRA